MIGRAILCILAVLLAPAVPAARAQSGIQLGILECRGLGSTSFVIGSVHDLECVFRSEFYPLQRYHGEVRKFGLDLGYTEQAILAWGVFAPTRQFGPGDLAGYYARLSAGAAVGVGANANALVGGSNNSIALQPLSLEGQTGINVSAGIAELVLRYGP
jgi:hypothetical protein